MRIVVVLADVPVAGLIVAEVKAAAVAAEFLIASC